MKQTMLSAFLGILLVSGTTQAASKLWTEDYPAAVAKAKTEQRTLLLNFTGSDWCGWCIRLDKEVFSQDAFQAFAREKLVLVNVDFPRRTKLAKAIQDQNRSLAGKHGIEGFPTIVLLNPDESVAGVTGYQPGGAEAYVQHLTSFLPPQPAPQSEPTSPPAAP